MRCDVGKLNFVYRYSFSCAVFYEFTGTIVNRFLTNQDARSTLYLSYFIKSYKTKTLTKQNKNRLKVPVSQPMNKKC